MPLDTPLQIFIRYVCSLGNPSNKPLQRTFYDGAFSRNGRITPADKV